MSSSVKNETEVVIIGSGLAGLTCALALAPRPVTVITKTSSVAGGSSWWAQGGIAAAVGAGDSPVLHAADTIAAGAGLSDPTGVQELTEESAQGLQWLLDQGVRFDRTASGSLSLLKEAAHRSARVIHGGGDATGRVVIQTIVKRIIDTPSIRVLTDTFVVDLITDKNHVQGVVAFNAELGRHYHFAPHIVLATGGIGSLWLHTTNPMEASGDGLAMAARAGARMADLEFMQFHPTALAGDLEDSKTSLPLLTEALRGAGALLIDDLGVRFMLDKHEAAELAPRDVVARAIDQHVRDGHSVYLDLRPVVASANNDSFPQALAVAKQYGFDPASEALPVTPAAHYHMGGVATDRDGQTSIAGLWACGEVATTGVHGANRLAGNSLLEALTYARRVAAAIAVDGIAKKRSHKLVLARLNEPILGREDTAALRSISHAAKAVMSRRVGILRSGVDLASASETLNDLQCELDNIACCRGWGDYANPDLVRLWAETRNCLLIARLVTLAALQREESRGAHYREDYPLPRAHWCRHQTMTIDALREVVGTSDSLLK